MPKIENKNSGEQEAQAQSGFTNNGHKAIDAGAIIKDNTPANMISSSGSTVTAFLHNFTGDDLPSYASVTGIVILIKAGWLFNQSTVVLKVGKAGSGGAFSSTTSTQALAVSAGVDTNIYALGGSRVDYGIDWGGFTDISNLAIKIAATVTTGTSTSITTFYACRATVHYTVPHTKLTLKSGKLTLKSGTLTIK